MSQTAVTAIIRELDVIRGAGFDSTRIFDDWLDVVYTTLRMLPAHTASVLEHGRMAEDDEEGKAIWRRVKDYYGERSNQVFAQFKKAYQVLLDGAYDKLDEPTYEDIVGNIYMEWRIGNPRIGQYFTMLPLAEAMATFMGVAERVEEGLREALKERREYQMAELFGITPSREMLRNIFLCQDEPIDYEPVPVHDPCCGSGVMFLAIAKSVPRWMVERGLVRFSGQDIDATCVTMCRINVLLYGLNGSGIFLRRTGAESAPPSADQGFEEDTGGQLILL